MDNAYENACPLQKQDTADKDSEMFDMETDASMSQSGDSVSPGREFTDESTVGATDQFEEVPERTTSQIAKKSEVDRITQRVASHNTSVRQLQQSMLELEQVCCSKGEVRSNEASISIDKARKLARNHEEDLLEDM